MAIIFYLNLSFEDEILINKHPDSPQVDKTLLDDVNEDDTQQFGVPVEGLATLIGKDLDFLKNMLGNPDRIDPSEFGYEWWIYKRSLSEYIQVGVDNDKIVTLYCIGPNVKVSPFVIGQPVEEIYSSIPIEPHVNLEYAGSSYRFELTEDDMNSRPLVPVGDFYAQVYIDQFAGTLSSIRYLNKEALLKLQPYELVYLGELLEVSPTEVGGEKEISEGSSKQIFDISNIMRVRHGLSPLEWDEKVSQVALAHSIDMFKSEDFSHISKEYGELKDRLEAGEVLYQVAGENIAANYTDAPAVMEGWLNSKSHRETLLNGEYTHIGVGVYKRHYTQNFIQMWEE